MADETGKLSVVEHIFKHVLGVPGISKMVLVVGALLAGTGLAGKFSASNAAPADAQVQANTSSGSSSILPVKNSPDATASQPAASKTPLSDLSTKLGIGFVGGFAIGWAFRAFIKMMSTLTILGGVILACVSYFGGQNIDMSAAKEKYESAISWVTAQAGKLKDVAFEHLPGSGGAGAIGSFFGFRRKKAEA